jgi:hypothetical protein
MGQHGSAEEYFADMDAQAMNDEAMAAQSAEGEAAAAEAAQQSEGGHMDKLKRYYIHPSAGAIEDEDGTLCLSSDVEKLEANIDLLNTFITIRDERISVLEARVKEMDAQCQTHELRSVQHDADMEAKNARVKELELVEVNLRLRLSEAITNSCISHAENAQLKADLVTVKNIDELDYRIYMSKVEKLKNRWTSDNPKDANDIEKEKVAMDWIAREIFSEILKGDSHD